MMFQSPGWFILVPLLLTAAWAWPRLGLRQPLRALIALLAVFALAAPQMGNLSQGMDLWVVFDRSGSSEGTIAPQMEEWLTLLEKAKPDRASNLKTLHVAGALSAPDPNLDEMGELDSGLSRLRLGIEGAAAYSSPERPSRILLFTDGYSTESLSGIGESLADSQIPLDLRILPPPLEGDLRVQSIHAPQQARPGEAVVLSVSLAGADGEATVEVSRDGVPLGSQSVTVSGGRADLRFSLRLTSPGAHKFSVRVRRQGDLIPGNNVKDCWVEMVGGPRVLLVTRYPDDPMADALRAAGFEVDQPEDPRTLNVGRLSGCRSVIIHDIPAPEFSREFLESLDFFVRGQGGGLLMVGGKNSFGSGGYFESPIDPLLPVSMELKSEHRKLSLAMGIVMDRSGSMSAGVGPGATKMSLANEGAGRAIELLGETDYVTVFAVDSSAHEMVPVLEVGPNRTKILDRVRRVQSRGGGIYVYTGLAAARKSLAGAPPAQRHIILFSDAADSEEPGDFRNLVSNFTADGGTVSVIGLGTPKDSDAAFLEEIAAIGGGRIFFSQDATDLPNLFAQDAAAVARSAFLDSPVGTVGVGGWVEIAGAPIEWLPQVDGYNLCYIREGDTAVLRSEDEYSAPLVALGRRGLGRSMAITFPMAGEFGKSSAAWPEVGSFVQTLADWLAGSGTPRGVALRTNMDGTNLDVALLSAPEEWAQRLARTPPKLALALSDAESENPGSTYSLPWRRIAPGTLRARDALEPGQFARGAIQVGDFVLPFGPLGVSGDVEWEFDPARPAALRRESALSGGREIVDLGSAWERPVSETKSSLVPHLTIAIILLALLEAFLTRVGRGKWVRADFALPRLKKESKSIVTSRKKKVAPDKEKPEPSSPVQPPKRDGLSAGLSKARRRKRR